ncbi:MAG TPA: hypothetical protein PLR83_04735 [Pyrinomonadaceae bacterium]|nr:hypothetical protein [Pyrinomonadaceae bacterium]
MTKFSRILCGFFGSIVLFAAAGAVSAQSSGAAAKPAATPPADRGKMSEFRGIRIGMEKNEVKKAIDKDPVVSDDSGFYYVFSDSESAQISLDDHKKVRAIAVMYSSVDASTPKLIDVLGKDATVKPADDGQVYDMVRYPEAGYWISYNRSGGDSPRVTIMIQKIEIAAN